MIIEAKVENLEVVLDAMHEVLESQECPMKCVIQLDISIEEMFVNVAHYAYEPNTGDVEITFELMENPNQIMIVMSDSGKPYNPLSKEDPDITLSAEEREIGGLGIWMTKKYMDDIQYEYKDKKNIIKMIKKLQD